jgi:CheY-like chemotaxis protein
MRTETSALQIFIAEDSRGDVLLVKEALAAYGLTAELQLCKDGEAALSELGQCEAGNLPDLIIIDLNLPRVDGMEVLRHVRGLPIFDGTPIMVFTSSRSTNDRTEAERFGANAYVSKPSTLDEFLSTVGSAIRNLTGRSGAHENDSEGRFHGCPCRPLTRFKSYSRHRASLLRRPHYLIRITMGVGIDTSEFRSKKENLR